MTIHVDEPQTWKVRFTDYCHMWSDSNDVDELHVFAKRLGLKPSWFQGHNQRCPHYDISKGKREQALRLGAVEMSLADWLKSRREAAR